MIIQLKAKLTKELTQNEITQELQTIKLFVFTDNNGNRKLFGYDMLESWIDKESIVNITLGDVFLFSEETDKFTYNLDKDIDLYKNLKITSVIINSDSTENLDMIFLSDPTKFLEGYQ